MVKCGEHPGDPINITYSGAAHSVYAKSGQGCSLVEIEPTIFQLLNLRAGKDTKCGLQVRARSCMEISLISVVRINLVRLCKNYKRVF